jgi:hypothetical protein
LNSGVIIINVSQSAIDIHKPIAVS